MGGQFFGGTGAIIKREKKEKRGKEEKREEEEKEEEKRETTRSFVYCVLSINISRLFLWPQIAFK
jgi:hypothetical protein